MSSQGPTRRDDDGAVDPTGRRLTVRHRLPRPHAGRGGPDRFADVVGDLVGGPVGGPDDAQVLRADGSRVTVRPDRVAAVRDIPPTARRPGPRVPDPVADAAALDLLAASQWPATTDQALGGWRLRAAGGFTRRADSALVVGDPGTDLPAALAHVRRWYAERGLPARLSCTDPGVVAAALAAGWSHELTVDVMTARVADVLHTLPDGWADGGPLVRLDAAPSYRWLADYRDAATHPDGPGVLRAPPGTTGLFATAEPPDDASPEPVTGLPGRGRGIVSHGWVGLSCLAVEAALRRRGLGRLVVATLLDAALDAGAVRAHLQVETGDTAAVAFHRAVGFRHHHTTVYLRPTHDAADVTSAADDHR